MGTQVRVTPLYGALSADAPLCYLLRVNQLTLLLDCGWDNAYNEDLLKPVLAELPSVDVILLSHADPGHLGALPYLVGRARLRPEVAIYATSPVHKMGQMFMYDQYLARAAEREFSTFTLDDVDAAFARVTQLRYQQTAALAGKGAGFSVTPFAAGHQVGGAAWRLTTPDEEDIVYAVDYNQRKERHLGAGVLEAAFSRPAVMITDAYNAQHNPPDRGARDRELLEAVMATLRGEGSVLMPVDTAGRVLELILLLEAHWAEGRLGYPLVLLTGVAYNTLEFAKSQLEWMNEAIGTRFNKSRDNPFNCRFLKLCHSLEELGHLARGPKLVLASLPSLEAGAARALAAQWAADARNAVIFTQRAPAGTLAHALQTRRGEGGNALALPLELNERVPLEGEELARYEEARQSAQQADEAPALQPMTDAEVAALRSVPAGASGSGSAATPGRPDKPIRSSSGTIGRVVRGTGGEPELLHAPATPSSATAAAAADSGGGSGPFGVAAAEAAGVLLDGFELPAGARAPMFPLEGEEEEEAAEWDEYGQALAPGEFAGPQATGTALGNRGPPIADEDMAEEAAPEERPTKVVPRRILLHVRARILQLDYEGRTDGRSMRTILAHIAPRHLILVHGSKEATEALRAFCATELRTARTQVHAPKPGEMVDASTGSSSYRIALSEALLPAVKLRPMGEYELGWVEGVVGPPAAEGGPPQLLPPAGAGAGEARQGGVFVGDVRLSELKAALASAGVAAEFYGGALVAPGPVTVRRSGEGGELVVEGPLSSGYYKVRDVVYGQYHVC